MEDIAVRTYATKDFYFVATLMSLEDVNVKIVSFTPYKYGGAKNSDKDIRVVMHLCGRKEDGTNYDAVETIEELQLRYLNGELRVEPNTLFTKQKELRNMVVDQSKRIQRKAKV